MVSLIKFDPYLLLTPERPLLLQNKGIDCKPVRRSTNYYRINLGLFEFFFRHCLHESYVKVEIRLSFSD